MTTREIGILGEKIAAKYLKKSGFRILERNKHYSHNELDIVARNKHFLLFVEVKTRSFSGNELQNDYGIPSSAVTREKQKRLLCAARDYIRSNGTKNRQPRMDVIEVYLEKDSKKIIKINHIENAFGVKSTF